MAVPQKVRSAVEETEETEDTVEGEAKLSLGSLFSVGGGGSHSSTEATKNASEVDKSINDQYRFSILTKALEEDETRKIHEITEGDDAISAEPGDLIRVTGTCKPDPLYPLLGAVEHITEATSEAPEGDGLWAQMIKNQSDIEQVQEIYQLLYGGWVGLGLTPDEGDQKFGVVLNENKAWVNGYREFRGVNEYTILGRVQEQIAYGKTWDLIEGLRVIAGATTEEQAASFRAEIVAELLDSIEDQNPSDSFDLPRLDPNSFIIEGPATILDPIAIHW